MIHFLKNSPECQRLFFCEKLGYNGDMERANKFILNNIKTIEIAGVVMRIISFSLVGWLGPKSPFMFVWIFNTTDAMILSWCSVLKKDAAYSLLNIFWIAVGMVGIARTLGII